MYICDKCIELYNEIIRESENETGFSASAGRSTLPKTYTNSIGMEFVLIPVGSFMMRTDDSEIIELKDPAHRWKQDCEREQDWEQALERTSEWDWEQALERASGRDWERASEWAPDSDSERLRKIECKWELAVTSHNLGNQRPLHRVTISRPFYLGKYPVTQRQWEAVMGSNPSRFQGQSDNPGDRVAWRDAQEFIAQLNRREGSGKYRLPIEAEWDDACRADTTSCYSFNPADYDYYGDDFVDKIMSGNVDEIIEICHFPAWYGGNSGNQTHQAGEMPPNPWGLYDMHGNVWEWVQDWYGESYYASSPGVDPKGSSKGWSRVLRGGGWYSDEGIVLLNTDRFNSPPNVRDSSVGFRLALSIEHP
jgi:formylglycine-generating enzyme required for sulfatase activity